MLVQFTKAGWPVPRAAVGKLDGGAATGQRPADERGVSEVCAVRDPLQKVKVAKATRRRPDEGCFELATVNKCTLAVSVLHRLDLCLFRTF